jgi:hypothetical protein
MYFAVQHLSSQSSNVCTYYSFRQLGLSLSMPRLFGIYHVYWCQQAGTHPAEFFSPLFYRFLTPCLLQLCLNFRAFESVHLIGDDVSARYIVSYSSWPFAKSCSSSFSSVYQIIFYAINLYVLQVNCSFARPASAAIFLRTLTCSEGARGSVVGWGAMLQAWAAP